MPKKYCQDCGLPAVHHVQTWLDEILSVTMLRLQFPKRVAVFFDVLIENFFILFGLVKMEDDFLLSEIQMRTACFITEARKRGVKFKVIKSRFGYTDHFCAKIDDKKFRFDILPTADHVGKNNISVIDCKKKTKDYLKKGDFPVPEGRSFWFWQKGRAIKYGAEKLGFPLVVKPRNGSVSRHVTTNIKSKEELSRAMEKAIVYSPAFIVEKFIENSFVYRATVIDFDFIAVVRQVPANVTGDGVLTIKELVANKNSDNQRGESHQKDYNLYKIVINETTMQLLAQKDYSLQTIPKKGEIIYLQKNPFLKLGGDLVEVTEQVCQDNIQLFKDIAKFFNIRLTGMDFLIPDISCSWKNQDCGILELNSSPCIE
ncbi:hypothetical protein L6260_00805, partial [Candidatus Parcubacteria bacterium]|nr:hypothetical protein [Candidatus Parcubacteria bacterium]